MSKNEMFAWMEKMAKRTTREPFQVIGTVMLMTFTFSGMNFAFKCLQSRRSTHNASCSDMASNNSLKIEKQTENNEEIDLPTTNSQNRGNKQDNNSSTHFEFKLILLGATGSGKSAAGNVLLQTNGNDKRFETSCYAKSKTMQSSKLSVNKTITMDNVIKTYKIDIIDTPSIYNTELSATDVKNEIEKAKKLSEPRTNAFLLCVPANAITHYLTDDMKLYEEYFDGSVYASTIVVFTRCDQVENLNKCEIDCKNAMKQNSILKKMKHYITLSPTLNEEKKGKQLEDLIQIIHTMENQKSNRSCVIL